MLCFAEAGSRFDDTGGAYVYTRAAFGDFVGFEVGWMARVSSAAGLAAGFAQALTGVWPATGAGWGRAAAIALPLVGLTALRALFK